MDCDCKQQRSVAVSVLVAVSALVAAVGTSVGSGTQPVTLVCPTAYPGMGNSIGNHPNDAFPA